MKNKKFLTRIRCFYTESEFDSSRTSLTQHSLSSLTVWVQSKISHWKLRGLCPKLSFALSFSTEERTQHARIWLWGGGSGGRWEEVGGAPTGEEKVKK